MYIPNLLKFLCAFLSDRADVHGILTLRSLLQDGRVSLPNGETVMHNILCTLLYSGDLCIYP